MVRRKLVAVLLLGLVGAAFLAVPVGAQTGGSAATPAVPEKYAATASGNAFLLKVGPASLTFGSNNVAIDSTPKAHADGSGALLVASTIGGTSADSPAGGTTVTKGLLETPPNTTDGCGPLSLPAGFPALGLNTACSGSSASTANGLPTAAAQGDSVYNLSVDTASLIGPGAPLASLGTTLTGLVTSLLGSPQTAALGTLLNLLLTTPTAQVLAVKVGGSSSTASATADAVTSSSNATGVNVCVGNLPGGIGCLIDVTVGAAAATATCSRTSHVSTPKVTPALATVQLLPAALPEIYAIPTLGPILKGLFGDSGKLTVAPNGAAINLSPLLILTPSAGTTTQTATGASAAAASLQLDLLPDATTGVGAVELALSQAKAAVACTAAVAAKPGTPGAPTPNKLAFTGDSPWRPVIGVALLAVVAAGFEVTRRSRRSRRVES